MTSRRRWTSVTALAAALMLMLAACNGDGGDEAAPDGDGGDEADAEAGGDSDGEEVTVGFIVKALDQEFWLTVEEGAESAAAEDDSIELFLDGATDETAVAEQLALIEDMVTRGVDALAVAPLAPEQAEPTLQRAVDQGVPVLLVDTDIPEWDGKLTFIGTDNLTAGEAAGEYIVEQLGGEGTAAILEGVPGNTTTDTRAEGAGNVLEEAGIDVVAQLPANSDRAEGRSVTEDILTTTPEVDALFAANDQMALGALEALEAAGREGDDVVVVGFDGTSEAAEAILEGRMDASVAQMTALMGETGVEEAAAAARGEDVEPRIDTGYEMVTEENAEEYTE